MTASRGVAIAATLHARMTNLLERWSDDVWTASAPLSMMGLRIGTRMTVVRLPGGGLLLHSPIPLNDALRREIDALGAVTHIVAPNHYHHLHAGTMAAAYPKATLHAPEGLAKKRKDLRIDALLGPTHADWSGVLEPIPIEGSMLKETLFLHTPSRTLISSDLTENFTTSDHFPTRMYLKVSGVHGKIGWSRLLRFLYRDHAAARRSIDALLERDFDRAIIAHGDPIPRAAKDAVRDTFLWL